MSAVATLTRPQRLAMETFEAFRLASDGRMIPLRNCAAENLGACATDAAQLCLHKEQFVIRRTDTLTGEQVLKFYQVKQRAQTWMRIEGDVRSVRPLYADHLFDMRPEGLSS